MGAVSDPATGTGKMLAGPRNPEGGFFDTLSILMAISSQTIASLRQGANTTLAVVATNAVLTKSAVTKVAQMGHDGLARTIRPVHTMFDGDTIFAVSAGDKPAETNLVGALAAEAVAMAVLAGVRAAEGMGGLPAARDLGG